MYQSFSVLLLISFPFNLHLFASFCIFLLPEFSIILSRSFKDSILIQLLSKVCQFWQQLPAKIEYDVGNPIMHLPFGEWLESTHYFFNGDFGAGLLPNLGRILEPSQLPSIFSSQDWVNFGFLCPITSRTVHRTAPGLRSFKASGRCATQGITMFDSWCYNFKPCFDEYLSS